MHFTPKMLAKTPSITLDAFLPLSAFYTGVVGLSVHFNRSSICPLCNGTRVDSPSFKHVCFLPSISCSRRAVPVMERDCASIRLSFPTEAE